MAGNTTWVQMLDLVAIELPQCPKNVALQCCKLAAIAFCEDSKVWKHYPDALDVEAGVRDVVIDPPAGARICGLHTLKMSGRNINPIVPAVLFEKVNGWDTVSGTVTNYWTDQADTIKLYPLPTASQSAVLSCVAAATPKMNATGMPDWIWEEYHDAIAAKAKAIAFSMPKKPWSDPNTFALAEGQYREKLADARSKVNRGGGRAVQGTKPQFM